ncbi:hypothetical protein BO94DRAFT_95696 [Aspergillus sclerotioniger CBS 115572]|uniref:Uncharacterized protein n=1 Tax=Aspergillus sclerotioniger CBS 115572 TaxID=1450535 RepID=A0A317WHJ7_9EURO|nr:hypothetical protein BO94DRAFT_95696 [Aspergillus sclerotioniger CBS 115572]PWY85739.1 hypothetical protein BO94DRAFT_95696 [Aspergillus sclerotioniger CBS 115572]
MELVARKAPHCLYKVPSRMTPHQEKEFWSHDDTITFIVVPSPPPPPRPPPSDSIRFSLITTLNPGINSRHDGERQKSIPAMDGGIDPSNGGWRRGQNRHIEFG